MEPIRPTKEAAQGLWERMKGKFKKVAGAATGSEGLIASGELHEITADKHMEAAERKADADRLSQDAVEKLAASEERIDDARADVHAEEDVRVARVERETSRRKTAAEQRGRVKTRSVHKAADADRRAADRRAQEAQRAATKARKRSDARRAAARDSREAAAALDEAQRKTDGG